MHVIAGMIRSGSTLLQGALNQNPRFAVSSTSSLSGLCNGMSRFCSRLPELQAILAQDRDLGLTKLKRLLRLVAADWHTENIDYLKKEFGGERNVIFDKGRGWLYNLELLKYVWPEAKIIITVRDLRDVFASVEKQHKRTGVLNEHGQTIVERMSNNFSPTGIIGSQLIGIQNATYSALQEDSDVLYVRYEDLAGRFQRTMRDIYDFLKEDYYEHDPANIVNTSQDPDWTYLYKFPHDASGSVKAPKTGEWREHMSDSVGTEIVKNHLQYMTRFGYVKMEQQAAPSSPMMGMGQAPGMFNQQPMMPPQSMMNPMERNPRSAPQRGNNRGN